MATAADYNQVFELLGIPVMSWRVLNKFAKSYLGYEDTINITNDTEQAIKFLSLTGLVKGGNTDGAGLLYLSLASLGGSAWNIKVYASADHDAATRVASGTASVLCAREVALVEQGDSGITGIISLAAYSDDDEDVIAIPRWNITAMHDDIDPTNADDVLADYISQHITGGKSTARTIGTAITGAQNQAAAQINNIMRGALARLVESGNIATGNLLTKTTTKASGAVTLSYTGIVKDVIDQMTADSTEFKANTVSLGSLTSGTGQQGRVTATVKTAQNYVVDDDTFTIRCVKALGSETEEFSVKSETYGEAENRLRLGASFTAPELGIKAMTLDRNVLFSTYSPASGNTYYAKTFSNLSFTITGETSDFVDVGASKIYGSGIKASATDVVTISYYRGSSRAEADKIATVSFANPGNDTPKSATLTQSNSSGITIVQPCDDLDAMPDDVEFTWQVNLGLNEVSDYYKLDAVNNNVGVWSNVLGRLYKIEFPTNSSEDISEDYIRIWEDFLVDKSNTI